MGRRTHIYTEWHALPHELRIDATAEGVHRMLSHVRIDGARTRARLRRVMSCIHYDSPEDDEHDEGIRLCVPPAFQESPSGIQGTAERLGYRVAGMLEMLTVAKDHPGALMDLEILYGFGEWVCDPEDPMLLHVPAVRMSRDKSEALFSIELVRRDAPLFYSPQTSDIRRYFMLVERLRADYQRCGGCIEAPDTRPTSP